jgi:tRNA U34 2-thiouridine synthase MnmA/TrmU
MKAIALYSGGLDSSLAIKLMQRCGVTVEPVLFTSPYGTQLASPEFVAKAATVKHEFGLGLRGIPFEKEMIQIIRSPHFGWGRRLNPCIDCHLTMLRRAKTLLTELEADFVVTGEVLGQRPMSQNSQALDIINRKSGLEGRLLRPLSAQLLPPSLPETAGWIKRADMLALQGRGRKEQLRLAAEWGLREFGAPAGGCLLTDPGYAEKLRNLFEAGWLNEANSEWIKYGRFFSLGPQSKLMVARNEHEVAELMRLAAPGDTVLQPEPGPGSLGVLRGETPPEILNLAAGIVAFYSPKNPGPAMRITRGRDSYHIQATPAQAEQVKQLRLQGWE